ncbi:alpha/beta fold hydrolase [Nonomuraea sp. LPB2021202275-12-8]|uniref:alpha/beta fold hydrolase n=1 Tax=Nonomuraea sp. LPB2021202275-12-8 TaxID=3120159 RepID=UPI00300C0619
MPKATMHDGSTIDIEVHGTGETLLIPVNPRPLEGPQAEEMRKWGADPALGRSLIDGLSGQMRVAAFDYEGHVLAEPKAGTLTPDNVAADMLAVADAVGAGRFAYYGYSWLALSGLQLAIRTDRLSGLVMGGFPPVGGPYAEMLAVTAATHEMAVTPKPAEPAEPAEGGEFDWSSVEVTMTPAQTQQFLTLYEALRGFDDLAAQPHVTCPRLCFGGSADEIEYGERWGDVHVSIGGPIVRRRAELEGLGWDVEVLEGLDHTQAMQAANVLPILRPWLAAHV